MTREHEGQKQEVRGARPASGLVSLVTSVHDSLTIQNLECRLSRLRSSVRTGARLHCDAMGGDRNKYVCSMVTLTYAKALQWEPRHVSSYIKKVRHWCKTKGLVFRFAWVAEIQMSRYFKYGDAVVHYHVLVWLPRGVKMPFADEIGWWPHGMTKTHEVFAPVKYAVKYTSKGSTDAELFPKGARLHGVGGLDKAGAIERRWWCASRWVRDQTQTITDIARPVGGGILVRETGELLRSPWVVCSVGKGFVRVRRRTPADDARAMTQ